MNSTRQFFALWVKRKMMNTYWQQNDEWQSVDDLNNSLLRA